MDYRNEDGGDPRAERRRNIRDFCKGFFITLAIFLPLIFVVGYIHTQNVLGRSEPPVVQETTVPQQTLPASKPGSMNVLLVVSDEATGTLLGTALVRFDTDRYMIYVTVVPTTTIVLDTRAPMPLYQVFAQRGATGVTGAVRDTLSVPVDRYLALDTRELAAVLDRFGDFDFLLDKPLEVTGDNNLVVFSKEAGESSFSGNDAVNLIRFGNYAGEDRTVLYEKLWRSALMDYADEDFSGTFLETYNAMVNTLDTDIGKIDISRLTRAIAAVCLEDGAQIEIVHLPGNYIDQRFELADGSDALLWTYFTKIKSAA